MLLRSMTTMQTRAQARRARRVEEAEEEAAGEPGMAATAMATATISSKKGAMVAIRILLDTTPAGEAAAPPWTWLGDKCAVCGC